MNSPEWKTAVKTSAKGKEKAIQLAQELLGMIVGPQLSYVSEKYSWYHG